MTWGGGGVKDRMTEHGERGGGGEQSDNNFDPKCSSGYATSDSKSVQSDYRGSKRVVGVINVPQKGLKLPN